MSKINVDQPPTVPSNELDPRTFGLGAVGLGIVGLGGFGQFALQQFVQAPGVRLVGIAGTNRDEAVHAADRFGATLFDSYESLLSREDVDWVYINTPPFLHAAQAEAALNAGKHVLVEKPLATQLADAERLIQLARSSDKRLVTNLMQRYNPIVEKVRLVCHDRVLGDPLYFCFNNNAVDEGLLSDHWFWSKEKSGGIFVEHGVHFFDLARFWFGNDVTVLSSGSAQRPSDGAEDQVWCDVRYRDESSGAAVIARFYHGFNQSSRTESQTWQIVFEHGTIQMEGWIPIKLVLTAATDEVKTRAVADIFADGRLHVVEAIPKLNRNLRGHGTAFPAYEKIRIDYEVGIGKQELYGDLLYRVFAEQSASVLNPSLVRRLTEADGLESLRIAIEATDKANSALQANR
jgi:predicted dehydrogenase